MSLVTAIRDLPAQLGPLRIMLALVVVILILFPSRPGQEAVYSGIEVLSTLVAPVVAPIALMGLLLDLLMARVWLGDTQGSERRRMQIISLVDLALAVVLFLVWTPFFLSLGRMQ